MDLTRPSGQLSLIIAVVAVTSPACTGGAIERERVELIREHDVSGLNQALEQNVPTVDIVIFHSDNAELTWAELQEEFRTADNVFRSYGVQLNLTRAVEVSFPPSWKGMASGEATNLPTNDMELDFYEMMDYERTVLPERLASILSAFVPLDEESERTVYVIPLTDLTVSWFERNENHEWIQVTSPTSAISFPPYLFANRIPRHLSGVISFQRSKSSRKTMAHELGHKLINVSHEGLNVCPQGSGTEVPGLMGYGESTEIFGGREGRWHQERLLLSPFLYRLVGSRKVWNRAYENGGSYNDPIYGELVVQPACP